MNEGFNNLFRKPKERNKGEVFYITKKVKGKDGKRIEKEFVSVAGIELEVNKEGRGTQFDKSEFEDFALA